MGAMYRSRSNQDPMRAGLLSTRSKCASKAASAESKRQAHAEDEGTPLSRNWNNRLFGASVIAATVQFRSAGESNGNNGERQEAAAGSSRWPVLHARRQEVCARRRTLGPGQGGHAVAGAMGPEGHRSRFREDA